MVKLDTKAARLMLLKALACQKAMTAGTQSIARAMRSGRTGATMKLPNEEETKRTQLQAAHEKYGQLLDTIKTFKRNDLNSGN